MLSAFTIIESEHELAEILAAFMFCELLSVFREVLQDGVAVARLEEGLGKNTTTAHEFHYQVQFILLRVIDHLD